METTNDTELDELQGVYEKMDAEGKQKMLLMAESLLNTQELSINGNVTSTSISYSKSIELVWR